MPYQVRERKRRTVLWLVVIGLTVVTVAVSMLFIAPPPPKTVRMATGQPGGGYDSFGRKYQEKLAPMGLQLDLLNTNGSIDNIQRLARGEVDVAFVQGGTYGLVKDRDDPNGVLRALAAVYHEPLWVFSKSDRPIATLSDFQGKTITIGPPGSGTEVVSRDLLKEHGIDPDDPENAERFKHLSSADARRELEGGGVDVAFFVSAYTDQNVHALLEEEDGVQLLSFRQDIAYSKRFSYLTPVKLAEGMVDLRRDIPSQDKVLLAPSALLVARADLHPDVVVELLKVARSIHEKGNDLDPPHRYPTLEGVDADLPPHESASTFMNSGESFLSRVLPYWALRWALRLQLLILPLLAVWVPFVKVLPMIYNWRVNRLLHHHYAVLREVESSIAHTNDPTELRERVQALEHLRTDMEALSRKVPARLQRDVYHWRLHVSLVRAEALDHLQRLEAASAVTSGELPGGRS
jgi:TRAP transporter TAXI family solute receptor